MGWFSGSRENQELSFVKAVRKDIQIEEFPEGPYGAAIYLDQRIGKSSEWEPGQQVVDRFKDENPAFSNRRVAVERPEQDLIE